MRSKHVEITVDLPRIRAAAERIKARTGVRLIAVIKSDAYGLGAKPVAEALAGVADEFAYFSLDEAREVGRPGIVLGPPDGEPAEFESLGVRPAVGNRTDAERYAGIRTAIHLDTGMHRFGCPPEELPELLRITGSREVITHAAARESALALRDACAALNQPDLFIHAAATSLLDDPDTWLDAVRPGLALYRGAVRVTAKLLEVRDAKRPIGYGGFQADRVGVILAGYANGLRPAPVVINGRRQQILEVGMNSAFVSVDAADCVGDEVVLLGDGLSEAELGEHLAMREQEVLCRYCELGRQGTTEGVQREESL